MYVSRRHLRYFVLVGVILTTYAAFLYYIPADRRYSLRYSAIECQTVNFQKTSSQTDPAIVPPPPAIIHQSWKSRHLPAKYLEWSRSWNACYPNWHYRLWTDEDNLKLVRGAYPQYLDLYLNLRTAIERADMSRYLYMHRYGGIYSDLDTQCLRPFDHLLKGCSIVLGAMRHVEAYLPEGYVQNSFMYAQPGHPFWLHLITAIGRRTQGGVRGPVEDVTGPRVLMDLLHCARQHYDDICIYPPVYFNPFSWSTNRIAQCKSLEGMSPSEESECRRQFNASYVIQYHAHSW